MGSGVSSWGNSWGTSWGVSWGVGTPAPVETPTQIPTPSGGSGVLGRMPPTSRTFYPNLHADTRRLEEARQQDEEEEALVLALALMSSTQG